MNNVTIDPMVAYSESQALTKYYHDRNLLLANRIAELDKEKSGLEAEIARLNGVISQGQQEIKDSENGSSTDQA